MKRLLLVAFAIAAWGCSSSGNLSGFSQHDRSCVPQIVLRNANWEKISVAIAEFNLAKGRKLDLVRPNELVLYEARLLPDSTVAGSAEGGAEQIVSKTIYDYTFLPDSVIVTSHRYWTHDLDDTSVAEANDAATVEAEQRELGEIAHSIEQLPAARGELAAPVSTQ